MKSVLFTLILSLCLGLSNLIQGQQLNEDQLERILSMSDSMRQTLIYQGIVQLDLPIQQERELLQVWRNQTKFYHHQTISQSNPAGKDDKNSRKVSSRREFRDFRFLPEKKYFKLLLTNYTISFKKADPVAGQKTMCLTIKPKHLPRFGLSIWFDARRFHILRREINYYEEASSTLIFSMKYKTIKYDVLPPDSLVMAQKRSAHNRYKRSNRPEKIDYKNLTELKAKSHKTFFAPDYLPPGFELVSIKSAKDHHRDFVEMHFADGVLNLSIFQFFGNSPGFVRKMLKNPPDEKNAKIDFRQIYAVKKGGITFLLLGNFPLHELKKVANSLKAF